MKTAVIILNWNSKKQTLDCIDRLLSSEPNVNIVVVDNGSTDGSAEYLTKNIGNKITLLINKKNLGFTGGVNTGIRWCLDKGFAFIALLNNDAMVEKSWLSNLVLEMDNSKIGIVTGLFLNSKGNKIDSTGDWYSKWGLAFPRSRDKDTNSSPAPGFVFGGTGGASLYRSKMLRQIGLFDEDFFAYFEDVDISFRAQLMGWKVYYTPKAIAYHERGSTSVKIPGFSVYQMFKNLPILFFKNVPIQLWFKILPRFLFAYKILLLNSLKKGDGKYAIKGSIKGFLMLFKKVSSRHNIQKNRKVSIEYISSMIWNDLPPEQKGLRKLRKLLTGVK